MRSRRCPGVAGVEGSARRPGSEDGEPVDGLAHHLVLDFDPRHPRRRRSLMAPFDQSVDGLFVSLGEHLDPAVGQVTRASRTHRASDLARHRNPGTRRPGPFPSPIDGSAPYGPKISTGAPAPRHARRTRNITSGASPRRNTPPSSVGAPNSLKGHREQPRDGPLERGAERHGANSQPRGSFLVRSTSLSGTMAQ